MQRRGPAARDQRADDAAPAAAEDGPSPMRPPMRSPKRAPIPPSPMPPSPKTSPTRGPGDEPNNQDETWTDRPEEAGPPAEDAYDLWSGWTAHAFATRPPAEDGPNQTQQWRAPRSMSIDGAPSSSELPALATSLQTLSMDEQPRMEAGKAVAGLFTPRPRSFSDYTSLHSDAWLEPQQQSQQQQQQRELSPVVSANQAASGVEELWRALKTGFATRHVMVRSAAGCFDRDDAQRVADTMRNFGSLARVRQELARDGLLFFTFHALKAAIAAVKTLNADVATASSTRFSPARVLSRAEAIQFCLPYERADDGNCATLVVTLGAGEPESSTAMRQFCARFGDVASVMQHDVHAGKYIVEFNDCRAVPGALDGLASCFHPNGPISAVRAPSPTLDAAKTQLFHDCVERLAARRAKVRPKSFSSTSTSMLTSPTSSVGSSLNASFLEPAMGGNNAEMAAMDGGDAALAGLIPDNGLRFTDERIWSQSAAARGRSSSMHAGPINSQVDEQAAAAAAAAAADRFGAMAMAFSGPNPFTVSMQTTYATYPPARHADGQPHFDFDRSERVFDKASPHMAFESSSPTLSSTAPKFSPASRPMDEYYRGGPQQFVGGGGGVGGSLMRSPPTQGRHDQGTGEFCLSLDRVASGEDKRTTLMIRNIPNKYTQQMLLAEINARHRGQYDFFYLPIDFKNKCNMGYAFINFLEASHIVAFYDEFDGQKWTNFNSEKVCAISYARLQGKQAMITRFQNSSLLDKHESYRPLVFCSTGPNRGKPEQFPTPRQLGAPHKKQPSSFATHYHRDDRGYGHPHGVSSSHHHRHYYQQPSVLVLDPQHAAFLGAMPPHASFRGLYTPYGHQPPAQGQPLYDPYDARQFAPSSSCAFGYGPMGFSP